MRTITEIARDLEQVTTDERQAITELRSFDEQRETQHEIISRSQLARRQLLDELQSVLEQAVLPIEPATPAPV